MLSVTVKFDGVDGGRDGSSPVAASLLFRLFVPEGLAFGVLQCVVCLLAPIATRSQLEEKKRVSKGSLKQTCIVLAYKSYWGPPWL